MSRERCVPPRPYCPPRGVNENSALSMHAPCLQCTSRFILTMSKSILGFGVFVWLLMCKPLSGMNSEDFSPGLCKQSLCFGPHPKAGRFLQSPLLEKHHLGLTEVQRAGAPRPCGMFAGISQGKNSPCRCCPGWEHCEPITRMATETQMVGAAAATGLWSWWEHGVFFIALSFFISPHFCPLWNALFLVLSVFITLLLS